jgi:hypothetical protein
LAWGTPSTVGQVWNLLLHSGGNANASSRWGPTAWPCVARRSCCDGGSSRRSEPYTTACRNTIRPSRLCMWSSGWRGQRHLCLWSAAPPRLDPRRWEGPLSPPPITNLLAQALRGSGPDVQVVSKPGGTISTQTDESRVSCGSMAFCIVGRLCFVPLVSCIRNCTRKLLWCCDVASWASCRGDRVVGC